MKLGALFLSLLLILSQSTEAFYRTGSGGIPGSGGVVTFTPLHQYYVAATGCNDSYNGLSASFTSGSNGPWCTPNHAIVCGDVLIAAASASYPAMQTWGTVSNCPSTSGGIDGTGGIYHAVLLCGGSYPGACAVTGSLSGSGGIEVNKDNWAVEGFAVSEGYTCSQPGYGFMINTSVSGSVRHYISFINDIAYDNAVGIGVNNHGANSGQGYGADYLAWVGNIVQNSAGRCDGGFSDGAIDLIGPADYDAVTGTHILIQGNFSYNNQQTLGASDGSDGECYLFDTLDLPSPGYGQQIVFRDNIGAVCERFGFQIFDQNYTATTPTIKVYNNTFVASNQMNNSTDSVATNQGDLNIQTVSSALTWNVSVTNNIIRENKATAGGGTPASIFAIQNAGRSASQPVLGGAGLQNVIYGLFTGSCPATCDTGNATESIVAWSPSVLGTNYYEDPALNNLTNALANQIGVPNCSGFSNVAACEGVNFGGAATNPSLVYDLGATSAHSSGKGYQQPTTCVATDADYPTWLKGIVYLQWNGSSLTEVNGLVTRPCGM